MLYRFLFLSILVISQILVTQLKAEEKGNKILAYKPGIYKTIHSVTTFVNDNPIVNDSCNKQTMYRFTTDSLLYITDCNERYLEYVRRRNGNSKINREYLLGKLETTSNANRYTCSGYYILFVIDEERETDVTIVCLHENPGLPSSISYLTKVK